MTEGKTLQELNVQPGDVVRLVQSGSNSPAPSDVNDPEAIGVIAKDYVFIQGHGGFTMDYDAKFVLVSPDPTPSPPGHVRLASGEVVDLTANRIAHGLLDEEVRAAMEAHGGPFHMLDCDGKWENCASPRWLGGYVYRVRPAPVAQTPREWWLLVDAATGKVAASSFPAYCHAVNSRQPGQSVVHVREVIGGAA